MAIFARMTDLLLRSAGNALSAVVERVRTVFEGDPETRRKVAFSIAMIALSAKMAKADGIVTRDEVIAFEQIFTIPAEDHAHVARLYNLAKQDVAGFEAYAAKMATLCGSGESDCPVLEDILDGLFHIAKADGVIHENELGLLREAATIFSVSDQHFEAILARHVDLGERDPYRVLGVARNADFETIRAAYRNLMRENHPDALVARGVPEEFLRLAHDRTAAITAAFDLIRRERKAA